MGIINSETFESFTWFFEKLRDSALGRACAQVKCLITDGDNTMRDAARVAFPDGVQLLCAWHVITKTTPNKIAKIVGKDDLKKIVGRMWEMAKSTEKTG